MILLLFAALEKEPRVSGCRSPGRRTLEIPALRAIPFCPALWYHRKQKRPRQATIAAGAQPKGADVSMWAVFALGSAVFAALTSILAKVGIEGVNSNLATALRTVVVLAMAWGMVFLTGAQGGIGEISRKSWLFLILSGLATGASWLCYYRALQIGEASKVVPVDKLSVVITLILAFVFLHEKATPRSVAGCVLIAAGTLLMVL